MIMICVACHTFFVIPLTAIFQNITAFVYDIAAVIYNTWLYCRIYEGLHNLTKAVKFYKDVLHYDATYVEAIACIGTHHFYSDQPEVALRFYR